MLMGKYENHTIGRLARQLEASNLDRSIIDRIMAGGEDIRKKSRPEARIDWLRGAMFRMDELLDYETRRAVREGCACCLGGLRLKQSTAIAREHSTLEDRVKAANQTRFVFGHSVTLEKDEITVCFAPPGLDSYRCSCLPKAREPLPITYCFCCGGHVKHHLQHALGRPLVCTVKSSALASGGRSPCTFSFKIRDTE